MRWPPSTPEAGAEAEKEAATEAEEETRQEPTEAAVQIVVETPGQVGVPGGHATLTTHPAMPVGSTGSSGRGRGTVLTATIVHGGTMKTPSHLTIETSSLK